MTDDNRPAGLPRDDDPDGRRSRDDGSDGLLARRRPLNGVAPGGGRCVLYLMSRDQRTRDNHALLAAQRHAIAGRLPLVVAFVVYARSGFRAREHYDFMLTGLADVEADLAAHGIGLVVRLARTSAAKTALALVADLEPAAVYVDFSPLRGPRRLRATLAASAGAPVFEVDTHNVVPAWLASDKLEFAARTIRPKIHHLLPAFLREPPALRAHPYPWPGGVAGVTLPEARAAVLPALEPNGTTVAATPGQDAAAEALKTFLARRLARYADDRNDPTKDGLSGLSPYFHFGQLATLRVALAAPDAGVLIEEMVVRKELSDNFCLYQRRYDSLAGAPDWARRTLAAHAKDNREHLYSYEQLRDARTHDEAWNAAQREMTRTGKMHGYMRMYWAKKILEWSPSADVATAIAVRLNDFYEIDGGDPNGYAGILWSIAGVHDRPWAGRPVFGQIRYMNEAGLKRKFRIADYVARFAE